MNIRVNTLSNINCPEGFQKIKQKFESYPIVFSILLALGAILLTYKFLCRSDSKKEEQPKKEPLPEIGSSKPSLTELEPEDDKKKENPETPTGSIKEETSSQPISVATSLEIKNEPNIKIDSESSLKKTSSEGIAVNSSEFRITGNISFILSLTFQKISLFSRINLKEIDLYSIFLRDENFSGEVFSSVFNELYDDALERVSKDPTPSSQVKSFNGELIGSDPHHLYLKVRIDQTTEIELPSHLFFDSEGELIDPIRFYLNDQYHCLSLKDSISQCKESYRRDYFDPESIKQLRNFVYSFDQKWNELLLENDILSFIPANAIEFRRLDDSSGELGPFEKKKIPRGDDIIPILYERIYLEAAECYIMRSDDHSLDSLSNGKLRLILNEEHNEVWVFIDRAKTLNCLEIKKSCDDVKLSQQDDIYFSSRKATIIKPTKKVDFQRATLDYIAGALILSLPYSQ